MNIKTAKQLYPIEIINGLSYYVRITDEGEKQLSIDGEHWFYLADMLNNN